MIDSINKYATPAAALSAFSAAGFTFIDGNGIEHILQANIEGAAICEVGQLYTMTDPGTPGDPLDPPTYTGDGFHWVVYRHLNENTLPAALLPATVWNSLMPTVRPTDGTIPNQFWL